MDIKIIDISRELLSDTPYPGDPAASVSVFSAISRGDSCNMAEIRTTLHNGTHADAPLHFVQTGKSITQLPLEAFIGECQVIEVPEGRITGEYVNKYFPRTQKRILIKGNGKAFFDKTGAEEAAFLGISLIGTDGDSIGEVGGNEIGPHRAFMDENIAILERLDLSGVKPGKYILVAQPLKIQGVEASPVRACLLDGYIFWSKS